MGGDPPGVFSEPTNGERVGVRLALGSRGCFPWRTGELAVGNRNVRVQGVEVGVDGGVA
jgi:hypothetical protein